MINFFPLGITSPQSNVLVIPLLNTDQLSKQLAQIAQHTSCSIEHLQADFKAEKKEIFAFYAANQPNQKVFLIGLGKQLPQNTPIAEVLRQALRTWTHKNKFGVGTTVTVDLTTWSQFNELSVPVYSALIENCVGGCLLGMYDIAKFKSPAPEIKTAFQNINLIVGAQHIDLAADAIAKAQVIAQAQLHVMDMVNLPSNRFTPTSFAQAATNLSQEIENVSTKIYKGNEIKEIGLESLWAVGKASSEPIHFCIIEYKPSEVKKKIGLVGKGITFDSGGLNIKTQAMVYMKSDMGGGAAVLGAIEAVAKLKLPVHLIAIIPTCENMISSNALKPSDVINSYSGYTIEVEDTDAEGRLILADGLSYLNRNYQPDILIDMATLTGASIMALSNKAGAILTKNDELAIKFHEIGWQIDERVWRLPMWDDYADFLKSDIADIKNLGGSGGGAITAAKFLEKFTDNHPAYVHIDMAGMVIADSEFAKSRSATAYGVRLLTETIASLL